MKKRISKLWSKSRASDESREQAGHAATSILSPRIGSRITGLHTSHPDIIKRLKRAEGHIRSVITNMEEGRACLEVAQQLQAGESAIANARRLLIHDHIDHCIEHAVREGTQSADDTFREFKCVPGSAM